MNRLLACILLSIAACQPAPVGVRGVELQRDSTGQCANLCSEIGLPLDSVVIMADNVGCVCRAVPVPAAAPPGAQPAASETPAGASASTGGMAAIMLARKAQEDAARRRSSTKPYSPPKSYSPSHH
jgi:hypothetical protein